MHARKVTCLLCFVSPPLCFISRFYVLVSKGDSLRLVISRVVISAVVHESVTNFVEAVGQSCIDCRSMFMLEK